MTENASDAARRWLDGQHRTWRWNDGSYVGKNRYEALETGEQGLTYFFFDGARAGLERPLHQSFEAFRSDGPLRPLPDAVRAELEAWLDSRAL